MVVIIRVVVLLWCRMGEEGMECMMNILVGRVVIFLVVVMGFFVIVYCGVLLF